MIFSVIDRPTQWIDTEPNVMKPKHYIFGYGSLVSLKSLKNTLNRGADAHLDYRYCYLYDYVRVWNLGMDNAVVIPNYKSYLEPISQTRPDVFITYLNVQQSPKSKVYGLLFEVSLDELDVLDLRERNYSRVDVTELLDCEIDGIGWVYAGKEDSILAFEHAESANRAVISSSYFELVTSAYSSLGVGKLDEFHQSTTSNNLPLVDLQLVRLNQSGRFIT
jgi:hypothetical protein